LDRHFRECRIIFNSDPKVQHSGIPPSLASLATTDIRHPGPLVFLCCFYAVMSDNFYRASLPSIVIPDISNRASICSVTLDSLHRESIILSFQMDPRLPIAGMTEKIHHARHFLSNIHHCASVTSDMCDRESILDSFSPSLPLMPHPCRLFQMNPR